MKISIDDRLALLKYKVDNKPHIILKNDRVCDTCQGKYCVHVCPASCYKLENNKIVFHYEDCVECGSCLIVCDKENIDWDYPRGSFGVNFRWG
ncbi:MAG: 4Fe-4S dicluster domain-containing protein [Thermoplasmata archaeon]